MNTNRLNRPYVRVRSMAPSDLAFADSLRALAGWNQTVKDWRRLLAFEPEGCFVAEWNGAPAGTATTTCYGTELAWIGMVLVHPELRRRGIGRTLLERCLGYLRDRAIRCIKLDATPLGKELYQKLGFRDEWPWTRWETAGFLSSGMPSGASRPWAISDSESMAQLDREAFGIMRWKMLEQMARASSQVLVHAPEAGRITGFGMLRQGARAAYLGPVVAVSADEGAALIKTLGASVTGQPIYWDIPDANASAVELAKSSGFAPQRRLSRMVLGENGTPGQPQLQFAIADPAIG